MFFLHKHKVVISFILISIFIIIFFSFYHWLRIKDKKEELPYLPQPGWSQPKELVPDLYSKKFIAVPEDNFFTLFWLRKKYNNKEEKLILEQFNYQGKQLTAKTIITDYALNSFTVEKINKRYYIFHLSGESERSQVLKLAILDNGFNILSNKIIKKGLSYAGNLKSDLYKNKIYLTYTNLVNNIEQIQLTAINIKTQKVVSININNTDRHLRYPDIIVNKNALYLSWLQQKNIFSNTAKSEGNKYQLYYNKFKHNLKPLDKNILIGEAYAKNSNDTPIIKSWDTQLIIIWNVIKPQSQEKILYYTQFDPQKVNNSRFIPINQLLSDPAQFPAIVKNNKYNIVYTGHTLNSLLKIISTDKLNGNLDSSVLFPGYKLSYVPQLFKDNQGNLNLLWIKLDNDKRKLYYAGTLSPKTQGLLKTLGLKVNFKDLSFITAILYFITFPLLPLFNNLIFCLAAVSIVLILYWAGKKFTFLNLFLKINNSYISYLVILLVIYIFVSINKATSFLFYPASPPENITIPVFIVVSLSGLLFLKVNSSNKKDLPLLWGACTGLIWFYWVAQANLIFHAYKFFL